MNFSQLHYFKIVAEEQHISRAAEKLHISQPSLSATIRRLEKELGMELFDHRGRNIYLNEAGQRLLNHTNYIFDQINLLQKNLKELEFEISHKVLIGLNNSSFLDNWLSDFLANNDKAKIAQMMMTEDQMLEALLNEEIDIGLGDFSKISPGIAHQTLVEDEYIIILPTDHPLASRDKLYLRDIQHEPFVSLSSNLIRRIVDNLFAQKNLTPNIIFEGQQRMMFRALFQKRGLLFSSRQMIYMITHHNQTPRPHENYHELRLIPVVDLNTHYNLSICWKKEHALPFMAEKLVNTLINEYPRYSDDKEFCQKDTVLFAL